MSLDHPPALPHDEPREILPDVLFVHGSARMGPGMTINRNMVVLRHEGELTLVNPIRLSDAGEKALEAFGTVRHAMRLGPAHGVDDPYTVARFGARFWCQAGSATYPEPKPDVVLEDGVELPIPDLELIAYRETKSPECVLLWRRHGGLLLSCDSIQHWERASRCSLPAKAVTYLMGFMHPANIGPPWRKFMTQDGGSLRPDFERILEQPFENLVGAHGQPLLGGANAALRKTVERVFA